MRAVLSFWLCLAVVAGCKKGGGDFDIGDIFGDKKKPQGPQNPVPADRQAAFAKLDQIRAIQVDMQRRQTSGDLSGVRRGADDARRLIGELTPAPGADFAAFDAERSACQDQTFLIRNRALQNDGDGTRNALFAFDDSFGNFVNRWYSDRAGGGPNPMPQPNPPVDQGRNPAVWSIRRTRTTMSDQIDAGQWSEARTSVDQIRIKLQDLKGAVPDPAYENERNAVDVKVYAVRTAADLGDKRGAQNAYRDFNNAFNNFSAKWFP